MNNEPVAWNYDNGKWEVCVDGYAVWLDSSDFTHDASLQVAGDFVDLPQKFAYAEEIAKRLNNSLYTHPVKEYKEPSVKEIEDLWLGVVNNIPANDHRPREWHFANAILTKASKNE